MQSLFFYFDLITHEIFINKKIATLSLVTMKLKAIIIDDERSSLANLSYNITAYFEEQIAIVAQTTDPLQGVELVNIHQPDILFLDIKMPQLDGFQVLERIPNKFFFLIFTTAYSDYGVRAIKASAFDYLLKPIDPLELKETVERILQIINLQKGRSHKQAQTNYALSLLMQNINTTNFPQQIMLPSLDEVKMIEVDEILYIGGDNNYSVIYMLDKQKHIVSKTLKYFEDLLDPNQFIRIHKSFLVQVKCIKGTSKKEGATYAKLENGEELVIARRRVKSTIHKLRNR